MALAIVGLVLIWTADETEGVELEDITTAEGLDTRIPAGWIVSEQFPFDFAPADDSQVFDQWTVARACPADGCATRSLDEWLALAPDLPLFESVIEAEGDDVFNIDVETVDDARILRAQTEANARLVFVAAFTDRADHYVACSVRLALASDQRLADEIIDVCRSTAVAEG